eukprot:GHVR01086043.1.p1 GENE.GHVR01086043.1~~GHVR01086043.1.p1  ORF type:complete len:141 (-),score=19.61 GHVR01086043.1:704-1126(-)
MICDLCVQEAPTYTAAQETNTYAPQAHTPYAQPIQAEYYTQQTGQMPNSYNPAIIYPHAYPQTAALSYYSPVYAHPNPQYIPPAQPQVQNQNRLNNWAADATTQTNDPYYGTQRVKNPQQETQSHGQTDMLSKLDLSYGL